ncbi:MAG: ATP-binding protein [Deltaproteobacteria bacterium]|jgi:anti-sigma regulatory factor (Ser/Thr protein kinase)|nr:ATP-binding protein [Deltaproteobacteria bacterium]
MQWCSQLELEIPSSLSEVSRARRFVREFCGPTAQASLDERDICQLELAVHEAAVNIIRHAYDNRMGQRILIEAQQSDEGFMFRLNHWGKSFDPTSVPPPALDGESEGGYGLFIISSFVDEVAYIQNDTGKSTVCLIKRRKNASG